MPPAIMSSYVLLIASSLIIARRGQVTHKCVSKLCYRRFRYFADMPLPEPMVTHYQLDTWEPPSVEYQSKYNNWNTRKQIWKWRLLNGGHFAFMLCKPICSRQIDWVIWIYYIHDTHVWRKTPWSAFVGEHIKDIMCIMIWSHWWTV